MREGYLFIFSAPSGAGKTTLCHKILEKIEHTVNSISYTTRKPRKNEQNGRDYFFISHEDFEKFKKQNFFAEWAQVYDEFYGTSHKFLQNETAQGNDVILDIDIQGAHQIKKKYGKRAITFFLLPPSEKELRKRLETRGTESQDSIDKRFSYARSEMQEASQFDYQVVNDDLSQAFEKVKKIILTLRNESTK
ncbi:MAG TPA: guanylate kinase [Bdellovibrionota bacterium]|nr:guanylate kinase [Bdellovibrionota bacterium]